MPSSNWFYGLIAVYYQSRLMECEEKESIKRISPIPSLSLSAAIATLSRQLYPIENNRVLWTPNETEGDTCRHTKLMAT